MLLLTSQNGSPSELEPSWHAIGGPLLFPPPPLWLAAKPETSWPLAVVEVAPTGWSVQRALGLPAHVSRHRSNGSGTDCQVVVGGGGCMCCVLCVVCCVLCACCVRVVCVLCVRVVCACCVGGWVCSVSRGVVDGGR